MNLAEATRILKQNLEKVKNIFLFTKNNGNKVAILDHGHLFLFFFSRLFKWFFSNGEIILIYFEKNWELDCYFEEMLFFFYDVFFFKKEIKQTKNQKQKKIVSFWHLLCHFDLNVLTSSRHFQHRQNTLVSDLFNSLLNFVSKFYFVL